MSIFGITFKNNGKIYYFNGNNLQCNIGDYVIVETEKGFQYGKIFNNVTNDNTLKRQAEYRDIIRIASAEDFAIHTKNLRDADKALQNAICLAKEYNLEMNFIDASYTFDRKQLLFNFVAEGRVDFRELAKKLAGIYKTRIELRQIGVRDKAKEIGGIGPCGKKLCCSSFLGHIDAVTINMAKNQNIALNPTKINGVCGRLLCCLAYENEEYSNCQKGLPCVGENVVVEGKKGVVKSVDVLNREYKAEFDGEIKTVEVEFYEKSNK